ncbi:MAG: efflux RND transporter permease subunit [Flavobacteriales bacterium]|nr:efflux RND transporter permease subunit [Flavobacteriales bacterium]
MLPSHLKNKKLQRAAKSEERKNAIERAIDYVKMKIYGEILAGMMRKKWLRRLLTFVPLIFMFIVGALLSKGVIKSTFFPAIPFDDFQVEIAYKTGESVEKTEKYLKYVEQEVFALKQELIEEFGDTLITFISTEIGNTEQLGEAGTHAGMVRVSLDVEDAPISSFEISRRVRERIVEDPTLEKFQVGGFNRWGSPVSIALNGDDYREIKKAKTWLRKELSKDPTLKNVKDNGGLGNREIIIELKPKAYQLGLTSGEIMRQIRQGFFGNELQRMIIGKDEVKVWVRYPKEDRASVQQMEDVKIRTMTGGEIPLKELADYKIERGEVKIRHTDGEKEIMVTADQTDPYASTSEINDNIEKTIVPKLKALFPQIDVEFRGQARSAGKSMKSLGLMAVLLLIMIVIILSLNFNSLYQGLMFACIIPIGMFCAQLGHGIEHLPFSILSFWGVIALMGILVNDAVVFLDTFNRYLKTGMEVSEAIYKAGLSRFRPIVLTSITTIAGLYPLIWESDFQAQFLIPMAVSVAYGVLFGTLFILFFFPLLVLFFNDMKRAVIWVWTGKKPDMLSVESAIIDMEREKEMNSETKNLKS